jgi:Polysaccharide lyase 14
MQLDPMTRVCHRFTALAVFALLAQSVVAQQTPKPEAKSPQGEERVLPPREITAATRGDKKALARLQQKGKVLLEDNFEDESSFKNYFEVRGKKEKRARLLRDAKRAHRGRGFIRFAAPNREGKESGAGASHWLGEEGYSQIYFRRYIRFPKNYDQGNLHHVGGGIAGVAGSGKWDEMGLAGVKPEGDDNFKSSFEPWRDWGQQRAPGYMFLYTYWMDMKKGRDGNYYGNMLEPAKKRLTNPPLDRWVCLEQMIKVNTVGKTDGELAAWIDGKLYLHFDRIRWRKAEKVKIKRVNFGIYVHQATRDNHVLYDDVVVSTGYVGPAPGASNGSGELR